MNSRPGQFARRASRGAGCQAMNVSRYAIGRLRAALIWWAPLVAVLA